MNCGEKETDVTPSSAPARLKAALPKGVPKPKPDKQSKQEDKELFGDDLRKERTKQNLHWILMGLLWVGAVCFYVVLVIRVAHYIMPETTNHWWIPRCWLNDEQLQGIDKFFFSGALGAAIAGQIKRNLGHKDERDAEG